MPAKLAAILAVVAVLCILLSTLFGVSSQSDRLLDGAQALFGVAIIIFTAYILVGIIRDARGTS